MKSYDEKKNDYYFITLHPVNYVVEENRDVIEYIKRDILFQLIKDNRVYDFKEGYDKIFDAVCNVESLFKLADFAASIIPVKGLKEGYESLKGLASTIYEKYKGQDVLHVVDDYLNGFYGKSGSISECDAFTCQIEYQESLKQVKINGCWGIRNGLKKKLLILKIYCGMFNLACGTIDWISMLRKKRKNC